MKKLLSMVALMGCMVALVACAPKEEAPAEAGMENPIVAVDNADAFADLGITIDAPEGATDVTYNIIAEETAEVNFKLDGADYNLRASKILKDAELHGINGELTTADLATEGATAVMAANDDSGFSVATATMGDVNVTVSSNNVADAEAIAAVMASIIG